MCKYITRTAFIILFLSLTSCETCNQKPQLIQEKQPTNQKEKLKSEIKELELERKQHITKLMDDWFQKASLTEHRQLLKQGDIEEIYKWFTDHLTKQGAEEKLNKLRDKAKKKSKEDYSTTKEKIAILEKDLYKIYECHFLIEFIQKTTKQEVDEYFESLEEKERKGTLNNDVQKKQLQLLRNWKAVEPILKLEQEKREALKKLQETKKS
jgi:hypothetical protein